MSSPRRLLLAAAAAVVAAAAGASPAAAITVANTCPSGAAADVQTISTTGDQPNPAKTGTMQLCGRTPLATEAGSTTELTVADGSLPTNPTYPLDGGASIPVFSLDVASVDWGDGSTPTFDIPTTGPITAAHAYDDVTT